MGLDLGTLLAALLTGTAGGAAVQLLTARRDARSLRSSVLGPLADVERLRWDAGTDEAWEAFLEAAHRLQAAAVVGGVRQDVTDTYLAYARAAFLEAKDQYDTGQVDDYDGPGLSQPLSAATTYTARLVSESVWKPWRTRVGAKRALGKINRLHDDLVNGHSIDETHGLWHRHHVAPRPR